MTTQPSTPNRRAVVKRAGGRKTVSRFAKLSGGDESAEILAAADGGRAAGAGEASSGGITEALTGITAVDGHVVQQIAVDQIASHPFNDPERSKPQPNNPKWEELVGSIAATGVKVPALLVTRSAFLNGRPELADQIGEAWYVVIYGDRRRTATIAAGLKTLPAVVDDSVMDDNGDLDAMAVENMGRQDLAEMAEARLFARYADVGFGQRAIADKLGIDQATVSRRLALLLLTPELQAAVEGKSFTPTEAAALAGALPCGPVRRWQKKTDPDQNTDLRHTEQLAAWKLITEHGQTASRAADRIIAERQARERAEAEGVEIIDPQEQFGENFHEHRIYDPAEAPEHGVVAAIDPVQGNLAYYAQAPVAADPGAKPDLTGQTERAEGVVRAAAPAVVDEDARAQREATKVRRLAGARLAAAVPAREVILAVLIEQYANGVATHAASSAGHTLADEFVPDLPDATLDAKQLARIAWARAVAGFEIVAADKSRQGWDAHDVRYLALLADRAGYEATPWEMRRLDEARRVMHCAPLSMSH